LSKLKLATPKECFGGKQILQKKISAFFRILSQGVDFRAELLELVFHIQKNF